MNTLSRRRFLSGTASASLALPLLETLRPRVAGAAAPKRLVLFASVLGTFPEQFWPRPPGARPWVASDGVQKRYRSGATPLDTTAFDLQAIGQPLAEHKKDLIFLEGLSPQNVDGHGGYCNLATAATEINLGDNDVIGGGISIDQAVAQQVGGSSRFRSLQIGVGGGRGKYGTLSFYDKMKEAPPESNPRALWERVFMGVAGDDPQRNAELERQRARGKSVLDGAMAQTALLKARLSRLDQEKLDAYLQSLREVEARLAKGSAGVSCAKPTQPRTQDEEDWPFENVAPLQVENLAMAFACDLTRVATFQIGFEGTNATYPHLGVSIRHHQLSHCDHDASDAPIQYPLIGKINVWNAQILASIIARLKAIPEGTGSVFDNTLIVWINGLTMGALHTNTHAPVVIAGGGGFFKTGRHVRLVRGGGPEETRQHSFADLWVQVGRAMGLMLDRFGEEKWNVAPLDTLRG